MLSTIRDILIRRMTAIPGVMYHVYPGGDIWFQYKLAEQWVYSEKIEDVSSGRAFEQLVFRLRVALGLSGQAARPLPKCASPLVRIRLAESARERKALDAQKRVDAQDRARYT